MLNITVLVSQSLSYIIKELGLAEWWDEICQNTVKPWSDCLRTAPGLVQSSPISACHWFWQTAHCTCVSYVTINIWVFLFCRGTRLPVFIRSRRPKNVWRLCLYSLAPHCHYDQKIKCIITKLTSIWYYNCNDRLFLMIKQELWYWLITGWKSIRDLQNTELKSNPFLSASTEQASMKWSDISLLFTSIHRSVKINSAGKRCTGRFCAV